MGGFLGVEFVFLFCNYRIVVDRIIQATGRLTVLYTSQGGSILSLKQACACVQLCSCSFVVNVYKLFLFIVNI